MMPLDSLDHALIIDNFAGGGGASTGIERALGRSPDVAINHDAEAVALHRANHPDTLHLCQNVWKADPLEVVRQASARRCALLGQPFRMLPVRFAWFSPDCKHFSKAKGSKPVEKGIRDLAWVVVHWARRVQPDIIALENVEEFKDWGPLVETTDGKLVPCPVSKGLTFKRWVRELKRLGYAVDWRELRACDFGAPTIRKRLFVVARRDGRPIAWAPPSHAKDGADGLLPWRTAAECIDWQLDCPSIFERDRPLAENTLRRVARGVMRYVVNAERPFIVGVGGPSYSGKPTSVDKPMGSQTTENHRAVVEPFVARIGQTGGGGKYVNGIGEPLTTVTSKAEHLVVEPLIAPLTHHGPDRAHKVGEPFKTVTAAHRGEMALIAPHVTKFRANSDGHRADEPMHTVTANSFKKRPGGAAAPRAMDVQLPLNTIVASGIKHGVVSAFLAQHNTGMTGHDAREPLSTIVGKGCTQGIVEAKAAMLSHQYGSGGGNGDPEQPARSITADGQHHAVVECDLSAEDLEGAQRVAAFIAKYYGQGIGQTCDEPMHTTTTKERFALVTVHGWPIVDIGLRMLQPRELYRAQGFPDDYTIDGPGPNERPLTKTAQVRMCGNSVCPPIAQAIARALVFGIGPAADSGERAAD